MFFKVGAPSAVMGGDMTATLAAPGLAVTDLFSVPGLDYLGLNPIRAVAGQYTAGKKGGLVQGIFGPRNGLLFKILTDKASPADVEAFYKLSAPTSFHGYIEAYYAGVDNPFLEFLGNDKYAMKKYLPFIDAKKNRGTFYRTKSDWIRRFLSLRPLDESLMMKLIYNQTLVKRDATASFDNLLNLAISESFSDWGLGDVPLWIYDMAWEVYGIDADSFNTKIKNRYKRNYEKDLQEAATDWEHLRQGQLLSFKQIEKISKYMGPDNWEKEKIKGMTKGSFFGIDQLTKDYGLKTKKVWYESLNDAGTRRIEYLRKMRANGEQLNKKPRIELSTIHAAKGGESQNVVLLTDLTKTTMETYERNADDENRLFYVGATRTKEHLHIISPKDNYKGYKI